MSVAIAWQKIPEVKYFLERMKQEPSDPAFRFNLSAFLAASHSVYYFLEAQYKPLDNNTWDTWRASKTEWCFTRPNRTAVESGAVTGTAISFLVMRRHMTIHSQPVPLAVTVTLNFATRFRLETAEEAQARKVLDENQESEPHLVYVANPGGRGQGPWFFTDVPGYIHLPTTEVMPLCEQFIPELEALITDCESKFP